LTIHRLTNTSISKGSTSGVDQGPESIFALGLWVEILDLSGPWCKRYHQHLQHFYVICPDLENLMRTGRRKPSFAFAGSFKLLSSQ
jgi:hypothetical protein